MIAEVAIGVTIHDVECHSAIKLTEILPPMKDEINDVKIAVICAAAQLHRQNQATT